MANCLKYGDVNRDYYDIVLIGRTGMGKSSTGNKLLQVDEHAKLHRFCCNVVSLRRGDEMRFPVSGSVSQLQDISNTSKNKTTSSKPKLDEGKQVHTNDHDSEDQISTSANMDDAVSTYHTATIGGAIVRPYDKGDALNTDTAQHDNDSCESRKQQESDSETLNLTNTTTVPPTRATDGRERTPTICAKVDTPEDDKSGIVQRGSDLGESTFAPIEPTGNATENVPEADSIGTTPTVPPTRETDGHEMTPTIGANVNTPEDDKSGTKPTVQPGSDLAESSSALLERTPTGTKTEKIMDVPEADSTGTTPTVQHDSDSHLVGKCNSKSEEILIKASDAASTSVDKAEMESKMPDRMPRASPERDSPVGKSQDVKASEEKLMVGFTHTNTLTGENQPALLLPQATSSNTLAIDQSHMGQRFSYGSHTNMPEMISRESADSKVRVLDLPGFSTTGETCQVPGYSRCVLKGNLEIVRLLFHIQVAMQLGVKCLLYFLPTRGLLEKADIALQEELRLLHLYFGSSVFEVMVVVATMHPKDSQQALGFDEDDLKITEKAFKDALRQVIKVVHCPPIIYIAKNDEGRDIIARIQKRLPHNKVLVPEAKDEVCSLCSCKVLYDSCNEPIGVVTDSKKVNALKPHTCKILPSSQGTSARASKHEKPRMNWWGFLGGNGGTKSTSARGAGKKETPRLRVGFEKSGLGGDVI